MNNKIAITALASISPLESDSKTIWENYLNVNHCFTEKEINGKRVLVAGLADDSKQLIELIKNEDAKYKSLDNSVLFGMFAARKAIIASNWKKEDNFGINMGSSRGATELFEKHFENFLKTGVVPTLTSPTTTLGNISSWIAHDLQTQGPEISHSITCSTALHAMLNGIAWLRARMAEKFLVGGSEAPLTPFTIAQMHALKIYAKENNAFPNRALDLEKKQNTLILGEGAAVCCLEIENSKKAIAYISGIGFATEILAHNISISAEANCFQKSMKMALKGTDLSEVDVVVMHAPGTIKGDLSEMKAIEKIFGGNLPLLTSNKWKIGHTFGASGMLSIEMAILMMQNDFFIQVPYIKQQTQKRAIKKVLINAVGFGGNAVSILLEKA